MRVVAIIPAHNEEGSVGDVVRELLATPCHGVSLTRVIVVDNASSDRTAQCASDAGAEVLVESELGYGAACLRGLAELGQADVALFVDADHSDRVSEWPLLLSPILSGKFDFVVGSRLLGSAEPGALLPQARFGNRLATFLMNRLYDSPFTDLGPFRAIRVASLMRLQMIDRDFGWTVEMQLKALRLGLRCCEVPVSYRKRVSGTSKVTGTVKGTILAGRKILGLVALEFVHKTVAWVKPATRES